MVDTIIPEIRKRMSFAANFKIQQDNARPHIGHDNASRIKEATGVTIVNQPPQLPELNINDLGLWRSLSTHVDRYEKTELDTLFLSIQEAYRNIDASTLDKVWKTKCRVVQKIIDKGGEAIEIAHS